jgi:hypothetical protein
MYVYTAMSEIGDGILTKNVLDVRAPRQNLISA